jgi:hypothetical protein
MASFTSPPKRFVLQDLGRFDRSKSSIAFQLSRHVVGLKFCRRPMLRARKYIPHIRRTISGPSVSWADFSVCSDTGDDRLGMNMSFPRSMDDHHTVLITACSWTPNSNSVCKPIRQSKALEKVGISMCPVDPYMSADVLFGFCCLTVVRGRQIGWPAVRSLQPPSLTRGSHSLIARQAQRLHFVRIYVPDTGVCGYSLLKWPNPHASRLILSHTRFLLGTFIVTSTRPGG